MTSISVLGLRLLMLGGSGCPWAAGPWLCPVSTLQGEVGASGMVVRDIKLKLGCQKYLIDCENELLHEIYEYVMQSKAEDWSRTVSEYCGRRELEKGDLKKIS